MKKTAALILALLLALGCCATAEESKPLEGVVVGFSEMETNGSYRIAEVEAVRSIAEEFGATLVYADAQSDTAKQMSDLEDMIAQGVDVIICTPREEDGLTPTIQEATASGIPVFLLARQITGEAGVDYVTCVRSDNYQQGVEISTWLLEQMGGEGNLVTIQGTAGATNTIERQQGLLDVMESYPDIEIIADQYGNFTLSDAQAVMENIIQAMGDEIDAVYCHNDDMAQGVINALKAAGKEPGKDVLVIGIDGQKSAIENILSGDQNATYSITPYIPVRIIFESIVEYLNGGEIEPRISYEGILVTPENAEEFLASGQGF